jgi:peroxisome-assembly ATPase
MGSQPHSAAYSAGHVAQFDSLVLCRRALCAADYLEIAQRFNLLFVKDIPRMGLYVREGQGGWRQVFHFSPTYFNVEIRLLPRCGDSLLSLMHAATAVSRIVWAPIFEMFSDDSNTGPRAPPSDHIRAIMGELV